MIANPQHLRMMTAATFLNVLFVDVTKSSERESAGDHSGKALPIARACILCYCVFGYCFIQNAKT